MNARISPGRAGRFAAPQRREGQQFIAYTMYAFHVCTYHTYHTFQFYSADTMKSCTNDEGPVV